MNRTFSIKEDNIFCFKYAAWQEVWWGVDLEPFREEEVGMGGVSLLQAVKAARASISFAFNT